MSLALLAQLAMILVEERQKPQHHPASATPCHAIPIPSTSTVSTYFKTRRAHVQNKQLVEERVHVFIQGLHGLSSKSKRTSWLDKLSELAHTSS